MKPRLGIIGRVDNRGIGYQTESYWNGLGRPRVLAVTIDDGWPCDEGRFGYDNILYATSNLSVKLGERVLDEKVCRQFLDGLDVVLAVETTYDWEFCNWAREMGVKTVIVGNPEMFAHGKSVTLPGGRAEYHFPHPDVWAWPTTWMRDQLPEGPLLPVPCEDRPDVGASLDTQELRILHVAGRTAIGDRNGTWEFIESLRSMQEHVYVTIVTQERRLPNQLRNRGNVEVDVVLGGVHDRWEMYENHHALVLPRKYGGLCLPALEAMACGLTVVMSDQSPNETWPGARIKSRLGRNVYTPAGRVPTRECHPMDIAKVVDQLARDRDTLGDEMKIAKEWAESHNWKTLAPLYWKVLS